MKNFLIVFCCALFMNEGGAEAIPLRARPEWRLSQADAPPREEKAPAAAKSVPDASGIDPAYEEEVERAVSTYKINYFAVNHLPGRSNAQAKFQLSMKFRILKPNLYLFKHDYFPAYFGYTQKSLWDVGRRSKPIEETNYEPEFFLAYPVDTGLFGRVVLRDIVVSPLEHQSNGLAGPDSRSWNRQYIMVSFGLRSAKRLETTNSFLADKMALSVRVWKASGYQDETRYLESIGSDDSNFLDYMGRGELRLSVRNFLWGGALKDHQLDIKRTIFNGKLRASYEFQFRQRIPGLNFAIYLQHWYGYGETLLRFNRFQHRTFAGLSFSY